MTKPILEINVAAKPKPTEPPKPSKVTITDVGQWFKTANGRAVRVRSKHGEVNTNWWSVGTEEYGYCWYTSNGLYVGEEHDPFYGQHLVSVADDPTKKEAAKEEWKSCTVAEAIAALKLKKQIAWRWKNMDGVWHPITKTWEFYFQHHGNLWVKAWEHYDWRYKL